MRIFGNCDGSAAVEAAIFTPIFLLFVFGITDLGSAMYTRTTVSAASQAGAIYAVVNSGSTCSSSGAPSLTAACLSGIKQAMNDATADPSFCSGTVCSASIGPCADNAANTCVAVTASYPYSPILPGVYSWAVAETAEYSATIRIQ